LNERDEPVVFLLWGGYARKKSSLIDGNRHKIIESAHPSPLSAHNGFVGSKPFSKANKALRSLNQEPLEWCFQ
jgi:uracil-DNA glycosylase